MTTELRIITREEWGARYGRGNDVRHLLPWAEEVYHTEAGAIRPQDWEEIEAYANGVDVAGVSSIQWVRNVERFHAVTRGWDGIAYSFLIDFDGTVFEGRGWGRSGAHTEGRNSTAAGVCFRGHGDRQPATPAQIASARKLTAEGIRRGHLRPRRRTGSHHEYSAKGKTCCGLLIRQQLHQLDPSTTNTEEFTMDDEARKRFDKIEKDQAARHTNVKAWLLVALELLGGIAGKSPAWINARWKHHGGR